MITIWGRNNSINVQKVMCAVGELGLEHERRDVGGKYGGLNTEEYGKLNPNRLIPTVVDGGNVVWESNACVRYLAAKYDHGGLYPETPEQRAQADMWMEWQAVTLNSQLGVIFWGLIRTAPEKRDMAAIKAAEARVAELWSMLDGWLANRDYVAGNAFTMGDIPVGCGFYRYSELPIERPSLPHCERWYESLKTRPAFQTHAMIPLT